jgi:hypothetical protein
MNLLGLNWVARPPLGEPLGITACVLKVSGTPAKAGCSRIEHGGAFHRQVRPSRVQSHKAVCEGWRTVIGTGFLSLEGAGAFER